MIRVSFSTRYFFYMELRGMGVCIESMSPVCLLTQQSSFSVTFSENVCILMQNLLILTLIILRGV